MTPAEGVVPGRPPDEGGSDEDRSDETSTDEVSEHRSDGDPVDGDPVDEASDESFPASDPPGSWGGVD